MRHLGCTGIVLIIMLTLASASASAMELPDIHPLPESETVTAEGVIKGAEAAVIETEIGEKLTAEELRPLFRFEKLSSLGSGDLHFSGVSRKGTKCNTEGDAPGVVLMASEFKWHYIILQISPALIADLVYLIPATTLICGTLKIKASGSLVVGLEGVSNNTPTTSFKLSAKCSGKGKQELTSYFNDAGTSVTKNLVLMNFGLG